MQVTLERRITNNCAVNEDAKAELNNFESPPLITPLTRSCFSDRMKCLLLRGEVKTYVESYRNEHEDEDQDSCLNDEQRSFQKCWNTTWCSKGKSFPKSQLPSRTTWMEPHRDVQDDWKNCDPIRFNFNQKMESKLSDIWKVNVVPVKQCTTDSLFARFNYGEESEHQSGNCLKSGCSAVILI